MSDELNLETSRNTQENLEYYEEMQQIMEASGLTFSQLMWDFPVFASRQQITYFLERYELFKKIQTVPGSIVEMGVAGGFGLMAFAHFCSIFEPNHYVRKLYGFDTFEGFPNIDEKDRTSSAAHMEVGGLAYNSYDYLKRAIKAYDKNRFLAHLPKVELIAGDATKTIPKFKKENPSLVIAMLYLDVDLYSPTKCALEQLMELVPKGGIVVFDELNHGDYPGETVALKEVMALNKLGLKRLPFSTMGAYAVMD